MGRAPRALVLVGAALAAACGGRACGGRGGLPPDALPAVKRGDGREYRVLDKGAWKGYYDAQGRVAVVEYDSNADGRADYIAHYDERRQIRLIEVDEDHDAWVDRFEHYDAAGVLEKVGRWRKQRGRADEWTYRAADGRPARIEYDDDGDGKPERADVLDKGAWKGYYDAQGRVAVVEYDSNADGRADYIAHYDERRQIRLLEVDEDHDAWVDRFEHYDAAGVLEKVGRWRKQRGRADEWTYRAADGRPARIEYDDDGDGKPERADVLEDGVVVRVETDSDRDGRPDRWQAWDRGRLVREELDTDGDGRPDRRLVFGPRARLLRVERLPR